MPRALTLTATLAMAMVLAGLAAICLGLVDAGHELDEVLVRLEDEAATLHRVTGAAVEYGAAADAITRPRTQLRRTVDDFGGTATRIVRESSPPYARPVARSLSASIGLVPAVEPIDRALGDYLDQTVKAQGEKTPTPAAIQLSVRMLDLNHEMLEQKIGQARQRTREAISSALFGVQAITLISIGIAALAVGWATRERRELPPPYRRR